MKPTLPPGKPTFFSSYFGEQAGDMALWRTPGYPAFLVPFYSLGLVPAGILYVQAVVGALIPLLTLVLAQLLTGSLVLCRPCGTPVDGFSTGIGLGALIMNDLFMAFIVAVGVYLLYWGTVREKASSLSLPEPCLGWASWSNQSSCSGPYA